MTYNIVSLIWRKPGLTPAEFRHHYDNVHVPLLRSLVGDTFPLTHTRNYITRHKSDSAPPNDANSNATWAPVLFRHATPADFDFDSITVMVWENEVAFQRFYECFYRDDVIRAIEEDEKNFVDREHRLVAASEGAVVTTRAD